MASDPQDSRRRRPADDPLASDEPKLDLDEEASGALPELLRRAVAMGLTGFFTTEGAIRRAVGDTLPKEWIDFANEQSERTRREMTNRMAEEMGRVLEKLDLVEVLESLLEGRTVEVSARFTLGPRDGARPGTAIHQRVVDREDDEPE